MKLEQFLGLTTTEDGRPVVTLLADPSMKDAGGAPVGFLSLVPHGANGRYFAASKSADLNLGEGGTPAPLSPSDAQPWWRTMFATMFGGVQVTKSPGDPVDFDQAMTVERLRRARWEATDALWEVIANIMESPDVADKPSAVATALQRFASHVNGLVTASLAMKAEDRAAIAREIAAPHGLASKAGRAISAANLAKITGATTALTAALAALQELEKLGEAQPTYKAESTEDPMLTPEQINDLARKAAAEAIIVAKGAGLTDPAKLAQVGAEAYGTIVAKVAPSGPPQPAMPQDTLAKQMAQSMGMGASMGEPMDQLMAALKAIPGLVAKVDAVAVEIADLQKTIKGHGEGATREPGVLEIATKSAELSAAVAERVAKIAPITPPPRGSSDPEAPRGRVVSKSGQADPGDEVFKDSPLGGFMGRGKTAQG